MHLRECMFCLGHNTIFIPCTHSPKCELAVEGDQVHSVTEQGKRLLLLEMHVVTQATLP